jgi:sugar lactone lactonase YvrE
MGRSRMGAWRDGPRGRSCSAPFEAFAPASMCSRAAARPQSPLVIHLGGKSPAGGSARATSRPGAGPRLPSARRACAALSCVLAAALCAFFFTSAPALAATGHGFLSSLTEAPAGTPLQEPGALAVDHADGRVFVADLGTGVVDVFSSSGTFLTQIGEGSLFAAGVAVDEASHDVYVADTFASAVLVFKPDGSGGYALLSEWTGVGALGEEFGEVTGVAVDNSKSVSAGDVYVVEAENPKTGFGAVEVFKPKPAGPEEASEGDLVRSLTSGKMEEPNGVAVSGSSGEVFVADSAKGGVYEFAASGSFAGKMTGSSSPQGSFFGKEEETGNVSAVAITETTGDLLVAEAERHVVSEFDPAGRWVGWITSTPAGSLGEPLGVAVAATGNVYVGDRGLARVDVFGPGVVVPDVVTSKATKPTRTSAILNGTINGEGKPGHYFFQWGITPALGSSTPATPFAGGEEKVAVTLGELRAGTTYFFRLAGENENGTNYGITREVTTPTAVEGLSTGPVQNLQPTSASLTGSLSPNGFEAHYYFEWGLTATYGSTSPEPPGTDAGSGAGAVAAITDLSALKPNTTYHYRLVGTNSFGTTFGSDQRFTTSGPPRITNEPTSGIGHEQATINAKINPDELATTYHFEYGESTAYGSEVPVGGASIGSGSEAVAVSAPLSGLKLGVTYHFRVIASNEAGVTTGSDQKFTTIPPALIDSTSVVEVTSTEATLQTQINPLGHDTTYFFQYGTESCKANPAGCTSVPTPPGADIGAGEADVPESLRIQGLTPHTTYHYRVLAINSLGTSEGAERTFTTQQPSTAFALLDGRAWEMVSPPDKHGAPVEALTREGGLILASEDSNALTYVARGVITEEAQGNRSLDMQQVLSTRSAGGWGSQDIATPSSEATGATVGEPQEYQFFTPDLSLALLEPHGAKPPLAPEASSTQRTIYIRDNAIGTYLPLVTEANVPPGTTFDGGIGFRSATPDLSHVVLHSKVALTGASSGAGLYEWAGGRLQFVSVLPAGTPGHEAELGFHNVAANAISGDGSRVIWTTPEEAVHRGHLYMSDTATGETLQLDAAQGHPEPEQGTAQFQTASSDGTEVLFTDKQRLTADSTAEAAQGTGKADLYECEVVKEAGTGKLACRLKDLTVDPNEGEHAGVQGFLFGASKDGTTAYIVAQGVLAPNENGDGEIAEAGKDNLYELHYDGTHWTTAFIAALSSEDSPEWEGGATHADTAFLTARVSPSGRYLAFMSAASLTGYDNVDANPEAKGARDEEVYLYDSAAASLTCTSCNPTGARPVGVLDTEEAGEGLGLLVDRRLVWQGHWLGGNIPGWTAQSIVSALFQPRYLSDSGRLFFNSRDHLVPAATSGKENVYEYEPSGVGSCQSPSGACVSLISSGSSGRESAFLEATPSGNDVFFLTAGQLLPQDTDTAFDVYDARVCTQGSPCLTPPSPPPAGCSEAGTCRPASPPQEAPGGPFGSATFAGPGNAPSPPPAKQQVKNIKTGTKPLTRAQKLTNALRACKKRHSHSKKKRRACEAHARKLYGPKTTVKAKKHAKAKKTSRRRSSARGRR